MDDATKAALASLGSKSAGVPPGSVKASGEDKSEDAEAFDIDALLAQSLDEVPDLPDFNSAPKEGIYRMKVDKVDMNKLVGENDTRVIQFDYTLQELIEEKGTSTGDPSKPGDKFSQMYFLGTAKGAAFAIGQIKKLLEPVAARAGTTKVSETIQAFEGCEVAGVIKHRRDGRDKDVIRASVIRIVFLD